jgi:branched-chain amino acid transport system substrate-binding protein
MKKAIFLVLSLFLLTACASTSPTTDSSEVQKVKLGVVAPLSGDAAAYGIDVQKVLDYQLERINQESDKTGYEYELVYEDGKCTGSDSVTGLHKLIDIDGVDFILGGVCSAETIAIAPIAQGSGVVAISGWSSNPDIEGVGDYIFTLSYSDNLVGNGIADELNQFKRVAMITEQNDFNVGIRQVIVNGLTSEVVVDETFEKGATDFRNILEKIANENPDVIFLNPNPGVTAQNLLKQTAEIPALAEVPIVSHYAYLADDSRTEAQEAAQGMILIDAPQLTSEKFQAIFDAIEAEKGKIEAIGTYYTASALDTIDILTDTIIEVGTDPATVKDALRTNTYEGYIGTIYFGNFNFVQNIPVGRYIVKDGEAVLQK